MRIVQGDAVPFEERKHQHRQGTFRFRRLLEGEPGSPGNFYFSEPIMMEPEHFAWVPVEGEPGVSEKLLGVFTERRTEAGLLWVEPGARHRARGRRIYLVVSGSGRVGGEPFRAYTTVLLERGETADFSSEETAEILFLGLPRVERLAEAAVAAERREPAGQPAS